jgi:type II secretory pathway pseudopilin PulG
MHVNDPLSRRNWFPEAVGLSCVAAGVIGALGTATTALVVRQQKRQNLIEAEAKATRDLAIQEFDESIQGNNYKEALEIMTAIVNKDPQSKYKILWDNKFSNIAKTNSRRTVDDNDVPVSIYQYDFINHASSRFPFARFLMQDSFDNAKRQVILEASQNVYPDTPSTYRIGNSGMGYLVRDNFPARLDYIVQERAYQSALKLFYEKAKTYRSGIDDYADLDDGARLCLCTRYMINALDRNKL